MNVLSLWNVYFAGHPLRIYLQGHSYIVRASFQDICNYYKKKKLSFSNGICMLCHFFLSLAFESYDLSETYARSRFYLISVYGTLSLQYLNYMFMNVSSLWKRQNEHQMFLRTNNLGFLVSLTTWTGSL